MICSKCGKPLEEDFKFCPECAQPVCVPLLDPEIEPIVVSDNILIKEKSSFKLKRTFLITMIISLSISALIGIIVIIIGNIGDIETKILLTTTSIGGFSLLGLCCSTLYEKNKFKTVSIIGMAVCVLGFIQSALLIWEVYNRYYNYEWPIRLFVTFIFIGVFMAQSCILLLINYKNKKARIALWITIGLICVVLLMILVTLYEIIDYRAELFFRFLYVFAILDALGTITTPLLNKIGEK